MSAIDFAGTATGVVTDLTAVGGPIASAITIGALVLAVGIGWRIFKRFSK